MVPEVKNIFQTDEFHLHTTHNGTYIREDINGQLMYYYTTFLAINLQTTDACMENA